MCAGTQTAASSSQQHRGKEVESLVSLVVKAIRKQAAEIRCPKEKSTFSQNLKMPPPYCCFFQECEYTLATDFFEELRTGVTLPSLLTKKCFIFI